MPTVAHPLVSGRESTTVALLVLLPTLAATATLPTRDVVVALGLVLAIAAIRSVGYRSPSLERSGPTAIPVGIELGAVGSPVGTGRGTIGPNENGQTGAAFESGGILGIGRKTPEPRGLGRPLRTASFSDRDRDSDGEADRTADTRDLEARSAADLTRAEAREILGVSLTADDAEIRTAYRRRIKAVHPDNGGSRAAFMRVTAAYERLTD